MTCPTVCDIQQPYRLWSVVFTAWDWTGLDHNDEASAMFIYFPLFGLVLSWLFLFPLPFGIGHNYKISYIIYEPNEDTNFFLCTSPLMPKCGGNKSSLNANVPRLSPIPIVQPSRREKDSYALLMSWQLYGAKKRAPSFVVAWPWLDYINYWWMITMVLVGILVGIATNLSFMKFILGFFLKKMKRNKIWLLSPNYG